LLAVKRAGRSLATDDFVADDRDLQADLLVQILPDHCFQKLLGLSWDSIDEMEPEEVLQLFRLKERDTLSEAAVSSRTVVTFVTWLISRTEFSSSELVL